jgi:hypothetical protein
LGTRRHGLRHRRLSDNTVPLRPRSIRSVANYDKLGGNVHTGSQCITDFNPSTAHLEIQRSANLRDPPMVRIEISGTDHVNDCCWGIHWPSTFAPLQRSHYTNG